MITTYNGLRLSDNPIPKKEWVRCLNFNFRYIADALAGNSTGSSSSTPDTLVKRDGSANFAAAQVTLSGLAGASSLIAVADATNLVLGTATGTKIGTSTSQKLGFFNASPIVQPSSTTDLRQALINLGLYATGGATPLNLNGGALTAKSATLTAGTITSNTPGINATQTWNNAGVTFTAMLLNVTNLASLSGYLCDLQYGGVSKFRVASTGDIDCAGQIVVSNVVYAQGGLNAAYAAAVDDDLFLIDASGNLFSAYFNGVAMVPVITTFQGKLGFFDKSSSPVVQQPQTTDLRTALVNYGLLSSSSGATPLNLNGGGLTAKSVTLAGTVTSNAPALNITQTWNNSGVTFYGCLLNVTNLASLSGYLLDLQVGGVSKFYVTNLGDSVLQGQIVVAGAVYANGGLNSAYISSIDDFMLLHGANGSFYSAVWDGATDHPRIVTDLTGIGFFGSAGVAQQPQTTDLRTALINYGLLASLSGATPLNLNGGAFTASTGTFSKRVTSGVVALSITSNAVHTGTPGTLDVSLGNTFTVTLNAATISFPAPANPVDGQRVMFRIKQDGTGSRTISWDTVYRFSGGTAPTLTTTINKTDRLAFEYNGVDSKWDLISTTLNL